MATLVGGDLAYRSKFSKSGLGAPGGHRGRRRLPGRSHLTQRRQDRLQRVGREVEKREAVYADFVMHASNALLSAYTRDEIVLGADEPRLIGLLNRMRPFASPEVVGGAEKVLNVIVEISLKPSIELRQLAKDALSKGLDPDPLLAFSSTCRADLDNVRRTTA